MVCTLLSIALVQLCRVVVLLIKPFAFFDVLVAVAVIES